MRTTAFVAQFCGRSSRSAIFGQLLPNTVASWRRGADSVDCRVSFSLSIMRCTQRFSILCGFGAMHFRRFNSQRHPRTAVRGERRRRASSAVIDTRHEAKGHGEAKGRRWPMFSLCFYRWKGKLREMGNACIRRLGGDRAAVAGSGWQWLGLR